MPANDFERRIPALSRRLEKANASEDNRKLIEKYKGDLEVRDYSKARIYKLVTHLKVLDEQADYNFEKTTKDSTKEKVV